MKKTPKIEFSNFGFKYDAQVDPTLYDINLTIYEGEKIVICGPSGCGKSTLAHCINGLIPNSYFGEISGSFHIDGEDMKDKDIFSLSKKVGTVLQDSDGQFIGLTVAEDIAFAPENDMVKQSELFKLVEAAARDVSILEHLDHAPHEISGGQKQRVSLAGVMVDDVDILLFDEPLANLDPATGKSAIELIDEIQQQKNATVIIIEHRLEDVLHRPCDRIILMNEGRIVSDSTPAELVCNDLLITTGIREPLYLTALKYAGVELLPQNNPQSIETINLSPNDIKKVSDWFEGSAVGEKDQQRSIILSSKNIDFTYDNGKHALFDISVDVEKGEMLSIVGKNGAGKSTFSKLICGFLTPQTGSLVFEDLDLQNLSIKERADKIGYVMQNPNQMLSKPMIFEEVALGLLLRGVDQETVKQKVYETLKICGLYDFRNWPVSALSYGQKKRVTIASIMVLEPDIIILDEPTAGQDYKHYTEIMEFLLQLNQRGITVIMITHDMHLMLEYCERAVVFSDGKMIADRSSASVLTSPDIIKSASLKETSLFNLALKCNIENPTEFVERFIQFERKGRNNNG